VRSVMLVVQCLLILSGLVYGLPANLRQDLPVLFMYGTKDSTAVPFVIEKSKKFIKRYQGVAFEGRGHWLMVEAKDEVTQTVINWLEGLTSSKPLKPRL